MTQVQISPISLTEIRSARLASRASGVVDAGSAEFDRMRRSQLLRQVAIALVFAFVAADVAIALDSLARL